MTSPETMVAAGAAADGASPLRRSPGLRVLRDPVGLTCLLVLTAIVVAGLLSPWLEPHDPGFVRLEQTDAAPFQSEYLLGADQYGRDILSRLLEATLSTLEASALMVVVSVSLGTSAGLVAGYFGGLVDDALEWVANVLMALPGLVLLISLYSVIGPNILLAMGLLGVLVSPIVFRLVRSLVLGVRHELYIDSARVSGLSDQRIIRRHVLRAIRGPIVLQSVFILAMGISAMAGLEFLGLGDRTQPSWGGMLQDAFANVYDNRVAVVWPVLLIGITTLCLVLLGNVVRDATTASSGIHKPLRPGTRRRLQAQAAASVAERTESGAAAEGGPTPLVEVRDLVVGYPDSASTVRTVVNGVDLAVMPGEVHGLVGESGSGKSQIVSAITGILPPRPSSCEERCCSTVPT